MSIDNTTYLILKLALFITGPLYVVILIAAGIKEVLEIEPGEDGQLISIKKDFADSNSGGNQTSIRPKPAIPKRFWRVLKFPPLPPSYIPAQQNLIKRCDDILQTTRRLLLTGPSGMGKTTFALDTCQRYKELNGDSPLKQLPVYVSLAKPRKKNARDSRRPEKIRAEIFASIGESIRKNETIVHSMLQGGNFFVIIDDIDYLSEESRVQLDGFIGTFGENSFMCIMIEKPIGNSYLSNFESVEMTGWDKSTTTIYLRNRIKNHDAELKLVSELEAFNLFQTRLTPLEVGCIANAYLKDPKSSIIFAQDLQGTTKQRILLSYLALILKSSKVERDWVISEIGKLALRQLVNERSYFLAIETGDAKGRLGELESDLLIRDGGLYSFVHVQYQLMLASLFAEKYPSEAHSIMGNRTMNKLLSQYIPRNIASTLFNN